MARARTHLLSWSMANAAFEVPPELDPVLRAAARARVARVGAPLADEERQAMEEGGPWIAAAEMTAEIAHRAATDALPPPPQCAGK